MSRDINTVGSRYVDKGNELLNRLDFVESHVTDLMDTVGIVLRQAYEDLMTSACPPGDVTISSADLERHQHLTVTYISTLHNLCKDFKCFGLSHVLLQVCIYYFDSFYL